jgi:putative DNA primase/helicase
MSDNTDFNDMAALYGEAEVARTINEAVSKAEASYFHHGTDAPEVIQSHAQQVTLTCAANIVPEAINWLWDGWLAAGKFHILGGAPGTGKTTLAIAFAATVSGGGCWPDGTQAATGNVLIWSGEDDPANTLVPRLIAADADVNKVHFVEGTNGIKGKQPFDPSTDMPKLEKAAQALGNVRLLIVDPIVSAVKGDANSNGDTRKGLQPLVDLGAALNCAVIGITHFSKGSAGRETTERVIGSIAFAALARVVLVAAKNQGAAEGEPSRILMRTKSNIGCDNGGFAYELSQVTLPAPHQAVQASHVTWGNTLVGTAREILANAECSDNKGSSAVDEACEFLSDLLIDGKVASKECFAAAKAEKISYRTLQRAKEKLNVNARKWGMKGVWEWSLPEDCQTNTKAATPKSLAAFENFGSLRQNIDQSTQPSEVF